jgi:hypothetical protein
VSEDHVHTFYRPNWNVHTKVGFHPTDGRRLARSKVNILEAHPTADERKSFLSQVRAKTTQGDPLADWRDEVLLAVEDAFETPGEWTPWIASVPAPPLPLQSPFQP